MSAALGADGGALPGLPTAAAPADLPRHPSHREDDEVRTVIALLEDAALRHQIDGRSTLAGSLWTHAADLQSG